MVSQADVSSRTANARFMCLNARGEPKARALPTPSNAQSVMHGNETSRNTNDNIASRTVLSPPPTNTLATATAIIQTLGLTNCRVAAPNTPSPSPREAAGSRDGDAL